MGPCINCPTQLVDQQLSASLQEIWQRTRQSGPCNLHGAPDKTACTFADGLDVAKQRRTQSKKVLHDRVHSKKARYNYNLLNLEFLWFFKGSVTLSAKVDVWVGEHSNRPAYTGVMLTPSGRSKCIKTPWGTTMAQPQLHKKRHSLKFS